MGGTLRAFLEKENIMDKFKSEFDKSIRAYKRLEVDADQFIDMFQYDSDAMQGAFGWEETVDGIGYWLVKSEKYKEYMKD